MKIGWINVCETSETEEKPKILCIKLEPSFKQIRIT